VGLRVGQGGYGKLFPLLGFKRRTIQPVAITVFADETTCYHLLLPRSGQITVNVGGHDTSQNTAIIRTDRRRVFACSLNDMTSSQVTPELEFQA
jgi:hypothetical protein